MLQLALANLKTYSRRFIAVTLAVMIGTAFLAATLMVNASATETLKNSIGSSYANADLVIGQDYMMDMAAGDEDKPETHVLGPTALKAIESVDGVAAVHGSANIGVGVNAGGRDYYASANTAATNKKLSSTVLETGALPTGSEQVAIDATYAGEYNISVGDVLEIGTTTAEGKEISRQVKVSGITAASNDPMTGSAMNLTIGQSLLDALSGPGETSYGSIVVAARDGIDLQGLKAPITSALEGTGLKYFQVNTPDEQIVKDIAAFSGGNDQLTIVLLVFALIALVVTGLVVMNTFAVLIAQRTRELALMRTLGALRAQIRSSVLIEALLVGLLASAAGVLLATGIMAALIKVLVATVPEMSIATLAVNPQAVIVPIVAGTAITLVAAWMPARKAMLVSPLAALRPADDAAVGNKAGKVRIVFGALLVAAGAAALAYGAAEGDILIAFGGGVLSFPGVLMLGSLFLPKTVSAIGALTSGGTVPGKLASLNAVRNPGRTTATATALLIGVTLVSMMMVGAQTAKASLDAALGSEYLVDVEVNDYSGTTFPAESLAKVKAMNGVQDLAELTAVGSSKSGQELFATDPGSLNSVLNNGSQVPAAGQVLVSSNNEGKTMEATGFGGKTGTLEMLITESNALQPAVGWDTATSMLGVTRESVAKDANARTVLWLKVDDSLGNAELRTLQADIADELNVEEYAVGGGVMEKQMFNTVIDMLLMIVSGLLAVAVLIALIGVANTLSLSVLERTRENSLLRALGLTRGQLKKMLATEAVLIGGVAALLGVLLGSAYGLLGAQSVMGAFGAMSVSIPWLQLAGVIAVSVVAALAASIVPARRAAKLAPVQGLASE
ncbi:ABC transporter permease [Paeniglutamicibacter psychrophenolicus]|uniref:ABC transporter permease n=1 Tax=Paeniglutamicibacter psychrophenolicus TaxID=257454 RepID=UPI00278174A9|nr:ABC transporter permease [Paeniglutamicibacter psychrophenolicus]MDQ0092342.1 putative ABC transport system permease protein [Paeniglutamicibacter psychrophenolicus]